MKVLVADKISPKGVAHLRRQPGFDVVEAYGSSPAKLLELFGLFDEFELRFAIVEP